MTVCPAARAAQLSPPMLRVLIAVTTGCTLVDGFSAGVLYFENGRGGRPPSPNTVEALISRSLLERKLGGNGKPGTIVPTNEGRRISIEQRHHEREQGDEAAS